MLCFEPAVSYQPPAISRWPWVHRCGRHGQCQVISCGERSGPFDDGVCRIPMAMANLCLLQIFLNQVSTFFLISWFFTAWCFQCGSPIRKILTWLPAGTFVLKDLKFALPRSHWLDEGDFLPSDLYSGTPTRGDFAREAKHLLICGFVKKPPWARMILWRQCMNVDIYPMFLNSR